ncbi:MAG: MHS family MFS transporter [Achromobacter sp.]|jgi:MFS family permease|uniref:Fosfomycin resistance protein AbaF n=1 Tax=Achromobacter insuavis TaxID=1287735 RepID=A0A6J5AIQ8_9BURK|nr:MULTISPECIES: MFS transporter [Achromobacter]MBN9638499.1 MHS family MFS transporter [Achromobacter sp.]CAB3670135.1 Fosfomycin resistance protein AbaF [Achromobacter insuavis]CUI93078.1 Inner membrane metabolite transport protein yhjE [Achromobacter sp. 2789STDY5608633]CUJ24210.1 Inner membrane metabolite transport protein yhjE [Achromobacter sp. 2789STDY5608628]CUJ28852.1 Inner membrane metabolite transport protein yhjE [Achromobacter sp. 2789STDY5608621]
MRGNTKTGHQPVRASTAAFIGTMIEWYDFYIYATAAALVFGKLFFPSATGFYGTLAAFGTFAVGFFARPLGGALFGHIGDRIGRKKSLVITLLMMGTVTVLIGLLPTYASIGVWAPVLLVLLRIVQGVAVGGEWGGAVLMAGEHSPDKSKRTFFASFAQLGSPAGLILSMLMFKLVTGLDDAAFLSWGWRVPFLFSAVLLLVGFVIRLSVNESPDFLEEKQAQAKRAKPARAPLAQVLTGAPRLLALAVGANVLGIAGFYFTSTFMIAYTTQYVGLNRAVILDCLLVVSIMQFFITPLAAYIASRVGNLRFLGATALISVFTPYAMFNLVDLGSLGAITLGIGVAVLFMGAYYAVIAGFVSDSFPTAIRYTGISMAYQLSGAIFGGLTPMLGTVLAENFKGQWWPLALLFSAISLLSLVSVLSLGAYRQRHVQLQPEVQQA